MTKSIRGNFSKLIAATFILIGVITATPVFALFDKGVLDWTYGVVPSDPMTLALLQHRGVLQAALGAALIWGAFNVTVRYGAAAGAIVTKGSFLALILSDEKIRGDLAAFSIVFDALCIVFFVILIAARITQIKSHAH